LDSFGSGEFVRSFDRHWTVLMRGSLLARLALGKVSYTVYNHKNDHDVSLILRKNHLRGKIQHRVLNFDVIDNNEQDTIGGIYPYSTHSEGSEYGLATAVKGRPCCTSTPPSIVFVSVPHKMKTETKATLLIAALILVSSLKLPLISQKHSSF
jgi:hypothetical protein